MTKRTVLSLLAIVCLIAIAAILAVPSRAAAQVQNPQCCTYFVDIKDVAPGCFPIRVKTEWAGGVVDEPVYFGNGVFWRNIPGPCPPARAFSWVSIDLGATQVHLWEEKLVVVGTCCYRVKAELNPNFCIYIRITKC